MGKHFYEDWLWEGEKPVLVRGVTWAESGRRKGPRVARTPGGSTDLCRGPWLLTWKGHKWKAGMPQLFGSLLTLSVTSFTSSKSRISECKIITRHTSFWSGLATLEFQVSGKQNQVHPGTVSIGLYVGRNVFMSLPVCVPMLYTHSAKMPHPLLCSVCRCLQWKHFLTIRTMVSFVINPKHSAQTTTDTCSRIKVSIHTDPVIADRKFLACSQVWADSLVRNIFTRGVTS